MFIVWLAGISGYSAEALNDFHAGLRALNAVQLSSGPLWLVCGCFTAEWLCNVLSGALPPTDSLAVFAVRACTTGKLTR